MTLVEDAARTTRAPDAAAVPVAGLDDLGRLRAENTMLQETVAMLLARVAELERRLGLNSSNSGKPPSSDGLHKPKREPRTRSLREPSGKPPGGQKGHKGSTLRQVDAPNHMVEHYPEACPACGSALTAAMSTGHSVRQVFDLPEPQPLAVTEHHLPLRALRRADTGRVSRWGHSAGAIRLAAIVVYLLHYQLLPEDRLAEAMADLFGVKLVAATIARMSRSCAERVQGVADAVSAFVKAAAVKHLDDSASVAGRSGCTSLAPCGSSSTASRLGGAV